MRTFRDQGTLNAPRYYSKAQITQGADRRSVPTRRIGNDGPGLVTTQPGFGARHDQLTPCPLQSSSLTRSRSWRLFGTAPAAQSINLAR